MTTIIFEAHDTTFDNESHHSSGWNDIGLSPLGMKQSGEMGDRYKDTIFDVIFTSDLVRASLSAEIGFVYRDFPIITDERLRECNYGELTQHPSKEVDSEKPKRIMVPFPGGESYQQTGERMKCFLSELLRDYDGKKVMVIGHRATQYGLDHWINGLSYEEIIAANWQWQPGWTYKLKKL